MIKNCFIKTKNGITLIALVITIIVLLILVGVIISFSLGNNGVLNQASNSIEKNRDANALEEVTLAWGAISSDYWKNWSVDTSKSISDFYTNDNLNKYLVDKGEVINNPKETYNGERYIVKYKSKDQNQEFVFIVDNKGNVERIEPVVIPDGLEIGTKVTYSPSGSYILEAQYSTNDTISPQNDLELKSEDGELYRVVNWNVFSLDKTTGEVELISTEPTIGGVRLQGAQGYNNSVYLLNQACNSLYGNGMKIKGRNLNIEDIEKRMTEAALATTYQENNYENEEINAYTGSKSYPLIYSNERYSVINENVNLDGLKLSQQDRLYEKIERINEHQILGVNPDVVSKTSTNGYVRATTSIRPYQTYWTRNNSFLQTAFKAPLITENDGELNTNYKLLFTNGSGNTISNWLSSRSVIIISNRCGFYTSIVYSGNVGASFDFSSVGNSGGSIRSLRPVVYLDVGLISGNKTTGFIVEAN